MAEKLTEEHSHGHGHEHIHEHSHGHGHEHSHEHEHGHDHGCSCGCGHSHETDDSRGAEACADIRNVPGRKETFLLENLGCANCAAKMESRIRELPQVAYANLVYATGQLQVVLNTEEDLLPQFQKICASIEEEVTVKRRTERENPAKRKKNIWKENRKDFVEIGIGALFLLAARIAEGRIGSVSAVLYAAGYLVLGREVVASAARNLFRGRVFDENFLMSVATLGAFAVGVCSDLGAAGAGGGHVEGYAEAVGVMLFYRIGELFEELAVARSRSQIMEAADMRPETVRLVTEEGVRVIPAGEACVGDVLLVRPGDRIPLDGRITEGETTVDTSPVTGEPVPRTAAAGDEVISGCVNLTGVISVKAEKELADSMVTRILDSVENAAAAKPKIDRFITRFSRIYTPVVVGLAASVAVLPSLVTGNWGYWIYTALTFLVISCPCALVLSVPLAFFSGIGAGSRQGILFKGGLAMEALQSVRAVVFDKTGTITEGIFVVREVDTAEMFGEEQLLRIAGGCEQNSSHPIAASIMEELRCRDLEPEEVKGTEEITGKGIRAELSGAEVLCGNRRLLEENGIPVTQTGSAAGTEVFLAVGGKYAGRIVIADRVKEDAADAVGRLKKMGVTSVMLTGDEQKNAEQAAAETGITEVHARLLPQDKVEKLNEIRGRYGRVMFVGDGINDAPVLAGADVGAAMGSGADAAIEAADVVFMTSSVDAVRQSVTLARRTGKVAMQNVVFALGIKAFVMLLGIAGFANMWMAVFADTGVAMLCILNSVRILYQKSSVRQFS